MPHAPPTGEVAALQTSLPSASKREDIKKGKVMFWHGTAHTEMKQHGEPLWMHNVTSDVFHCGAPLKYHTVSKLHLVV